MDKSKRFCASTIIAAIFFSSSMLISCSEHAVDTLPEWCEQITGVDLQKKYAPFWAYIFSVRFDGDAIRDDYVKFINDLYLEKIEHRASKMAWRQGTEFHLINLSSFFEMEPDIFISEWRDGIETDIHYRHKNQADICIFGTLTSLFDSLHMHSMKSDSLGINWTDDVTVIVTDRKRRLGNSLI